MDFDKLRAPFPPERVSWRVGSTTPDKSKGLAFAYIDARDVMDRLDEVCGPDGWQNSYPHANGKTVCRIEIRVNGEWIGKENGAGDSDVEAEKGALSDALKRAAVQWGIGRYLYDVTPPWVEIEPMGKSFKIKEHEYRRLRRLLTGEAPPPEKKEPEKPAAEPRKIEPPKEWIPLTANAFTREFIDCAKPLPKDKRQEHYRVNEATIQSLRLVSAKAAENIDNLFAELS
jgi:hypothetical protein